MKIPKSKYSKIYKLFYYNEFLMLFLTVFMVLKVFGKLTLIFFFLILTFIYIQAFLSIYLAIFKKEILGFEPFSWFWTNPVLTKGRKAAIYGWIMLLVMLLFSYFLIKNLI